MILTNADQISGSEFISLLEQVTSTEFHFQIFTGHVGKKRLSIMRTLG